MEILPRHVTSWAKEVLTVSPALVIEGARQVGKSTLGELISTSDDTVFVTLDDDGVRAFASDDPVGFIRSAGERRLVIDEVQRCPEVILPLKAEVDRDRRPGRFVLTGSANLLRVPGAQDSLAGRAMTIRLHPFSQGEIEGRHDDFVATLLAGPEALVAGSLETPDRSDVVQRMLTGGYPVVQTMSERLRAGWLKDYADRLIERDSTDLGSAQTPVLRRMLGLLAGGTGQELVIERLAETLGISRSTVERYLEILESLFLVTRLPGWSRSLTQRQIKRPKVHLTDTGLVAALNDLTLEHLLSPHGSDRLGSLVETFVVNELLRQQGWSGTPFTLAHFRDRNGAEADLIVETPRGVVAIEIKSASAPSRGHFRHLIALRDKLGSEFLAGVVLNFGPAQQTGDRLWSLPINSLWSEQGGPRV